MKEKYEFDYKSGDFKKQYDLLKKNFVYVRDKLLYINNNELFLGAVSQGFFDLAKYALQRRVSSTTIGLDLETAARRGIWKL